jgi:hypothetical protein
MTRFADRPASILDDVPAASTTAPAPVGGSTDGSVLDQLDRMTPAPTTEQPPASTEPAGTTTPQVPQ